MLLPVSWYSPPTGHNSRIKDVFFGYFKDDGFQKRRIGGRCDATGRWESIKKTWVDLFTNRRPASNLSVCAPIDLDTEWAAEEHLTTTGPRSVTVTLTARYTTTPSTCFLVVA